VEFHVFFALLLALHALDAWTTRRALKSGKAKEANGPLRRLMDKIGVKPAMLVVSLAALLPVWYFRIDDLWVQALLLGINAAAVINNLRVLRRIGAL